MSAMNGTLVQSVKISVRVFEIRPIYHLPEQLASVRFIYGLRSSLQLMFV